jgi:hypothetical protein
VWGEDVPKEWRGLMEEGERRGKRERGEKVEKMGPDNNNVRQEREYLR